MSDPTPEQIDRLRRKLGDRVPTSGDDSDTFFRNAEIVELWNEASGVIDFAALKGWQEKAAEYARLIDISESGSDRKLSQKHTNANRMVTIFRQSIADNPISSAKGRVGVVGRSFSLDECPISEGLPVPGEIWEVSGENIRYYPLKRSFSILR